jgi:hypothetical protein
MIAGVRLGTKAAVLGIAGVLLMSTAVNVQASSPQWALVSSPNKGTSSELSGVSCSDQTHCMTVGSYVSSGAGRTLSEKWNGTNMTIVPSPPSGGSVEIEFNAISCVSTKFCMAVGRQYKGGTDLLLAEKWNGKKWTQLPTPNLGLSAFDDLYGVSCKSSTWCMAVGWWTTQPEESYSMLWNGSSWTSETVPDTNSTDDNQLNSVSCVTTTFCVGVGFTSANDQLIDQWNGTTWSIVSTTANDALYGVRCRTTTFCMAVGAQGSSTANTLVEQWNGAAWSAMTSPNVSGSTADFLLSVSCTGTTFCMAGGDYLGSGSTRLTLTEDWTGGSTWHLVSSPNPSPTDDGINSVSCTVATGGGNFCLGVGSEAGLTLVEKYS